MLLAGTIAGPVRRLADGAERVRRRIRTRVEIPDFTRRRDEIGHLSGALRDMTDALYTRIEAIESFAADVAHELRNPLTSLRSAVETLPLAKTDDSRRRLLDVIEHDVKRLDRLISDISDASRLDAELQRQEAAPGRSRASCSTRWSTAANEVRSDDVTVTLDLRRRRAGAVQGARPRLAARPGGQQPDRQCALVLAGRRHACASPAGGCKDEVEIIVDDDGPGIRPDAIEKIFERFYTDRPHAGLRPEFRSRPVDLQADRRGAMAARIWAENRTAPAGAGEEPRVLGARFMVRLPANVMRGRRSDDPRLRRL